jgi:hypothetical protein
VGNPPANIPIAAMPGVEIRFDPAKEHELAPATLALGSALHADGTVVAVNRGAAKEDTHLIVIGARVPPITVTGRPATVARPYCSFGYFLTSPVQAARSF